MAYQRFSNESRQFSAPSPRLSPRRLSFWFSDREAPSRPRAPYKRREIRIGRARARARTCRSVGLYLRFGFFMTRAGSTCNAVSVSFLFSAMRSPTCPFSVLSSPTGRRSLLPRVVLQPERSYERSHFCIPYFVVCAQGRKLS